MSNTPPQWLSSNAAADYLGITGRTLYRLIDEGKIPAYKFGRVIRLKQAEVEKFIEESKIQPGTLKHLYPEAAERADSDQTDEDEAPEDGAA